MGPRGLPHPRSQIPNFQIVSISPSAQPEDEKGGKRWVPAAGPCATLPIGKTGSGG